VDPEELDNVLENMRKRTQVTLVGELFQYFSSGGTEEKQIMNIG
jgi:hypothetical protein